jgi:hypothetical protein
MSINAEPDPCWNCGELPVIEEKHSVIDSRVWKRYVCPLCRHWSFAFRSTKEDAFNIWNRSARMMNTKKERKLWKSSQSEKTDLPLGNTAL